MIRLSSEWHRPLQTFRSHHEDRRNKVCHKIGIPMIAGGVILGVTVVGLPVAAPLLAAGWGFNLLGHYVGGEAPAFVHRARGVDPAGWRDQVAAGIWWLEEVGLVTVPEPGRLVLLLTGVGLLTPLARLRRR